MTTVSVTFRKFVAKHTKSTLGTFFAGLTIVTVILVLIISGLMIALFYAGGCNGGVIQTHQVGWKCRDNPDDNRVKLNGEVGYNCDEWCNQQVCHENAKLCTDFNKHNDLMTARRWSLTGRVCAEACRWHYFQRLEEGEKLLGFCGCKMREPINCWDDLSGDDFCRGLLRDGCAYCDGSAETRLRDGGQSAVGKCETCKGGNCIFIPMGPPGHWSCDAADKIFPDGERDSALGIACTCNYTTWQEKEDPNLTPAPKCATNPRVYR